MPDDSDPIKIAREERRAKEEMKRRAILQNMGDTPMPLDALHGVREASIRLGIETSTLRKWILQRRIAVYRPSARAVRISEREIQAVLRKAYRAAVPTIGGNRVA